MIANDPFVATFGSVPAGDDESLIALVANAVREGFAVVLDAPGEKRPVCTLSARDRNAADRRAKEEARELGDVRWARRKHPCGLNHALTLESLGGDPTKVRTKVGQIVRRVAKELGGMPNIGVEIGKSGMLVVDVDTDAEWEGFKLDWHEAVDGAHPAWPGMTVRSPGKVDRDGAWVHKNGGHFWFTVPDDVELPAGTGSFKAPSGWVAMWNGHQVLVPPSARAEGAYELVGQTNPAPAWLVEKLISEATARMERAKARTELPDGTGDIDRWSTETPWADLLAPDGWEPTGLPDRCGCEIWTAPGGHASPKSATAHDPGCSHPTYDDSAGHLPLHVWTDNPPDWLAVAGTKTFSKIQYVAWREHDGDVRAVLRERGFIGQPASMLDAWEPPRAERKDPFTQAGSATEEGQEEDTDEPDDEEPDTWTPIPLHGRSDDELERPPTLMPRSDGAICLLYPGLLHSIHGESESGKSWVVQAEVVRLALEGEDVLFLDFENDWRAVLGRFRALGATEDALARIDYRNPETEPNAGSKAWRAIFERSYALVVIDGVTDALGIFRKTTKDNDEIATFLRKIPRVLARRTGAAVVMIDHVTKSTDGRGRWAIGGQAKMAGLDGAAYVVDVTEPLGRGRLGKLLIKVGKDKPGYVRGVAQGFDIHRLSDVAVFTLDATGDTITTELLPPPDPFSGTYFDPEAAVRVLREIRAADGMSQSKIEKVARLKAERVRQLLTELVEKGWLEIVEGPRNAKIYKITEEGIGELEQHEE